MAILTLRSDNPDLSWILNKNPATLAKSPWKKPLRKGTLFGWYPQEDGKSFRLYFKDADGEVSFVNENSSFEYLDMSRYASPYLPIAMVSEACREAIQNRHEKDVPMRASISTSLVLPAPQLARRMAKSLSDNRVASVILTPSRADAKLHHLEIEVRSGVHGVLNVLLALCVLQALADANLYLPLDESALTKYVGALNRIDAPYYMRYLFAKSAIKSPEQFSRLADQLQGPGMAMCFGDTRAQRWHAVRSHLPGGAYLMDLGCGELYQSLKLASVYDQVAAWDENPKLQARNADRLKKRNVSNVSLLGEATLQSLSELEVPDGLDILATEVIEHMPQEEAQDLLIALAKLPFRTLVLTTPNREFNVHYDVLFRHDDHHWEPSFAEFESLVGQAFQSTEFKVQIQGIGDSIDGIHTSLMAVIRRNAAHPVSSNNLDQALAA